MQRIIIYAYSAILLDAQKSTQTCSTNAPIYYQKPITLCILGHSDTIKYFHSADFILKQPLNLAEEINALATITYDNQKPTDPTIPLDIDISNGISLNSLLTSKRRRRRIGLVQERMISVRV